MARFCFLLFTLCHALLLGLELPNFDKAMGKGTTAWDCIRTPEDKRLLAAFKAQYESCQTPAIPLTTAIPKVIHWIWLGPKPFPQESITRMERWIALHPGWSFQLWTDQRRLSLPEKMKVCDFSSHLGPLADCYFNSDNFGEKSELLRLCVLLSEGGLYVDHDTEPLKSLEPLVSNLSFFCGLETLKPTILSSSVYPATHLIGSVPQHPVIKGAIDWLINNWDRLERQFPGSDDPSVASRVKHRGFRALSQGISLQDNVKRTLIFPSSFFSESHPEKAIYTTHLHQALWLKQSESEKMRTAFITTEKEINWLLIVSIGLGICNLLLCLFVLKTFGKLASRRVP